MKSRNLISMAVAFLVLVGGCAGSDSNPVAPDGEDNGTEMPGGTDTPDGTDMPGTDGPAESAAMMSIRGDTLFYRGGIDMASYEKFTALVRGRENQIKTLVVNSPGGNVTEGIKMGTWFYDNGVDVVIDTLCFSSCANYFFTAGREKIIRAGAIVGWHGSNQQEAFLAESTGKTLDQLLREQAEETARMGNDNPTPAQIEEAFKSLKTWYEMGVASEKAFLEKVGVPVDALVFGVKKANYAEYQRLTNANSAAQGWTFSIEDMAKLGIRNVTYQGPGTYPDPESRERMLVVVLEVQ